MFEFAVHSIATSFGVRVSDNVVRQCDQAGIVSNAPDCFVSDNVVSNCATTRITVSSVSGTFVAGTTVEDATTGASGTVKFWDSGNNYLYVKNISGGDFTATNTVQISGGGTPSATISSVDYLGDGIRLSGANNSIVTGNFVYQVQGYGITVFSIDDTLIANNTVRQANIKDTGFSLGATGSKSAFRINGGSGTETYRTRVQGNKALGSSTYNAIEVSASQVSNTYIVDNDLTGFSNSAISDSGTGTVQLNNVVNFSNTHLVYDKGLDLNDNTLKNLKNSAASALSGTQKDIEINIGGTAYYFTVYPTKA